MSVKEKDCKDNENMLKMPTVSPPVLWHHGTCDNCGERCVLVCHFGYNKQPERDYRICLKCMQENAQIILFGWMAYRVDNNIDRLFGDKEE